MQSMASEGAGTGCKQRAGVALFDGDGPHGTISLSKSVPLRVEVGTEMMEYH